MSEEAGDFGCAFLIRAEGKEATLESDVFRQRMRAAETQLAAARAPLDALYRDARQAARWERASVWYELSKHLLVDLNSPRTARELRLPTAVSNAFCKMLELLCFLDAPGPATDDTDASSSGEATWRHFDNASLPGDFVRAAQWRSAATRTTHDWRASSLLGESLLADRLGLVRDHPQRWVMLAAPEAKVGSPSGPSEPSAPSGPSEPYRGDLTDGADVARLPGALARCAGAAWRADLYTSDLGFAFDYASWEEDQQLRGHLGQVLAGLLVLRAGGTLVAKMFTCFRPESQWLLETLAARLFERVWLVKPATSKADNSECYIVACGFRPGAACGSDGACGSERACGSDRAAPVIAHLQQYLLGQGGTENAPCLVPSLFLADLASACSALCEKQARTLRANLASFAAGRRVSRAREVAAWKRRFLRTPSPSLQSIAMH